MSQENNDSEKKEQRNDEQPRKKRRRSRKRSTHQRTDEKRPAQNPERKPKKATPRKPNPRGKKQTLAPKPKPRVDVKQGEAKDDPFMTQDVELDPLMATISQSVEMWGEDDDAPEPDAMTMPSSIDKASLDLDPSTYSLNESTENVFRDKPLKDVVGARPHRFGRTVVVDIKDQRVKVGDKILVKTDRSNKLMTVTTEPKRAYTKSKGAVLVRMASREDEDRAHEQNLLGEQVLKSAKAIAKKSRVDIKIFKAENQGSRIVLYYSAEESPDVRGVSQMLAKDFKERIELRQTGVREQAKSVGGIGSCGMELCCSKWLPSFAPVSIKHAKDQGLSLNSSKISGKCGRLKCCLVYEHSTYAELRKGLPKLGKRVITGEGEGRVIEVDVLKQKIRVRGKGGNSKVYLPEEVEPMFPSQQQKDKESKQRKNNPNKGQEDPK